MELKGVEYHRKVRQSYLQQARDEPQRYAVVDAAADEDRVFARVLHMLEQRSGDW